MKNIPTILKAALNDVIKIINSTKASALNCRLFSIVCEDNDSEFKTLPLYTRFDGCQKANP